LARPGTRGRGRRIPGLAKPKAALPLLKLAWSGQERRGTERNGRLGATCTAAGSATDSTERPGRPGPAGSVQHYNLRRARLCKPTGPGTVGSSESVARALPRPRWPSRVHPGPGPAGPAVAGSRLPPTPTPGRRLSRQRLGGRARPGHGPADRRRKRGPGSGAGPAAVRPIRRSTVAAAAPCGRRS
jgi:hypothetical protein